MNERIQSIEKYIDVPGGQLYARTWSVKEAQECPIVLLHDSLGCVEMWRDFPSLLCERTGRLVIAYDRLGFGRSSKRQGLPSTQFISEEADIYLPQVLKAFNIEQFSLFGHSVGGAMAVVAAGHFGKSCLCVITESAQAFVEDRTRQGIIQAQVDFENPTVFSKLAKYHGEKTRWVLDAWIQVWLSQEFATWSLKDDLPMMTCPVLAIHGEKDEYGSVQFPEMIFELAGGMAEKKIIADCGHVPHREKQDLILDLVTQFIVSISPLP